MNVFDSDLSLAMRFLNRPRIDNLSSSYFQRHTFPLVCSFSSTFSSRPKVTPLLGIRPHESICKREVPASGIRPSRRTNSLTMWCKSAVMSWRLGVSEPPGGTRLCAPYYKLAKWHSISRICAAHLELAAAEDHRMLQLHRHFRVVYVGAIRDVLRKAARQI